MFTDAFGKIWYKGNLHTHTTNSDARMRRKKRLHYTNQKAMISLR